MPHRRTSLYACLRFLDGSKWCNKEHPYKPYIFVNCMADSCSIKCGPQYIRNCQLWKATSSILFYYMNYKENYLFWKRQRSTTFLVSIRPILPRARFRRKKHLHIGNAVQTVHILWLYYFCIAELLCCIIQEVFLFHAVFPTQPVSPCININTTPSYA